MSRSLPHAETAPRNMGPQWSAEARLVMAVGQAAEFLRLVGIPADTDAVSVVRVLLNVVFALTPSSVTREQMAAFMETGTIES